MPLKEANLQPFTKQATYPGPDRPSAELSALALALALPDAASALLADWLPALSGMKARLQAGARVADVACGPGSSIIRLAEAFPQSRFFGYDMGLAAIETARASALASGIIERTYFQIGSPVDFPGWGYDLICFLNGVLGLPNPQGAAGRVRSSLSDHGVWLIVEAPGSEAQVRALTAAAGFTICRCVLASATDAVYEVRC